jgi:hypothetical protein
MSTRTRLFPVPYYIGDGSERMFIYVADIAEYPRDADNFCAFCHGDPCAEHSGPESNIVQCYERWKATIREYGETSLISQGMRREGFTCPLCKGRPT